MKVRASVKPICPKCKIIKRKRVVRDKLLRMKVGPKVKVTEEDLKAAYTQYTRMESDMDVNCGGIADGVETVEACGQRIFDVIVKTSSGQRSKSEALGFGEAEFAPWPLGAVM